MVKRIIIWVLVIAFAYFFFSTIAKSCTDKAVDTVEQTGSAIGDAAEAGVDKVKGIASFDDDDLEADEEDEENRKDSDDYEINDEDDRASSDNEGRDDDDDNEDLSDEDDLDDEDDEDDRVRSDASDEDEDDDREDVRETSSSSTTTANSSSAIDNRYLVVAGSYKEETNADIMVDRLKELGYDGARVFSFDFAEYYSVTAGRFSSSSEASEIATELKAEGIDCYPHKMRSKYFD